MVKSRKDKNQRKSSKFRGKSRKNIKVGRKSIRRKMKGGAGGAGGAGGSGKGFVHDLTGVSTRKLWHNIFGPKGIKYKSARLQPYIDKIDHIFRTDNNANNAINALSLETHANPSIMMELKPYIENKIRERRENKIRERKETIPEQKEQQKKKIEREINENGHFVKQNIDFAKKYIDNMFKDTDKPHDYLQFEYAIFIAGIGSLVDYDTNLQSYMKLNDWREMSNNAGDNGHFVKQNIDFAKKYIDNMFEHPNKPRDYLQFEFDIFKAGIGSLVDYDTKLQLQLYMNTQFNNWRERSNNAAAAASPVSSSPVSSSSEQLIPLPELPTDSSLLDEIDAFEKSQKFNDKKKVNDIKNLAGKGILKYQIPDDLYFKYASLQELYPNKFPLNPTQDEGIIRSAKERFEKYYAKLSQETRDAKNLQTSEKINETYEENVENRFKKGLRPDGTPWK